MRAIRLFLLLPSVVALAGCGSTLHWTKPGVTEAEFNRDSLECAKESRSETFQWKPPIAGGPRYGPELDKDMYRACMRARSYSRNDPNGWRGFRD